MTITAPDHRGHGLVNLMAELERRLLGTAPMPGLTEDGGLPDGTAYVLVLFDGLGAHQVDGALAAAAVSTLRAGFPTTTTTSLATVATGQPPSRHGVIGHLAHLPGVAEVVNLLKWVTPTGAPVAHDYGSVLPSPNLWERLARGGVEPVTVQPGPFLGSPLSRMLYRGCRLEPAWTTEELVAATVDVARPGRLVFTYFPSVDVAAHVHGQRSDAYREARDEAARVWEGLVQRLGPEIVLAGTSDHGHLDYRPEGKHLIRHRRYDPLRFFGDPRSLYVSGPSGLIEELAAETGASVVSREQLREWLGPGPAHPQLAERLPDRLLLAPRGRLLLPRAFDKRLIGYHGGLEPEEMEIPLLVRA